MTSRRISLGVVTNGGNTNRYSPQKDTPKQIKKGVYPES